MIGWTGVGFVVPAITFMCLLVTQVSVNAVMKDPRYYTDHGWPKMLGFWIAAVAVWPVSRWTGIKIPGPEVVDPQTGQRTVLYSGKGNTFMWIPIVYWPLVLVLLGILVGFAL